MTISIMNSFSTKTDLPDNGFKPVLKLNSAVIYSQLEL